MARLIINVYLPKFRAEIVLSYKHGRKASSARNPLMPDRTALARHLLDALFHDDQFQDHVR
jgi:hypothetical protein